MKTTTKKPSTAPAASGQHSALPLTKDFVSWFAEMESQTTGWKIDRNSIASPGKRVGRVVKECLAEIGSAANNIERVEAENADLRNALQMALAAATDTQISPENWKRNVESAKHSLERAALQPRA